MQVGLAQVSVQWGESKNTIAHKVVYGETLWKYTQDYHCTMNEIYALNPALKTKSLLPGATVYLPKKGVEVAPPQPVMVSTQNQNTPTTNTGNATLPDTNIKTPTVIVDENALPKDMLHPDSLSSPTVIVQTTKAPAMVSQPIYHTVISGESLYGIVSKFHIANLATLKSWNHLTKDFIYPGEKLIVGYQNVAADANPAVTATTKKIPWGTHPVEPLQEGHLKPADTGNVVLAHEDSTLETKQISPDLLIASDAPILVPLHEKGIATWTKGNSGNGKYYGLHHNAPIGSLMTVTNLMNKKTIQVKIIGRLPDTQEYGNVVLKISSAAADALGVLDDKFLVDLHYMGYPPDEAQK